MLLRLLKCIASGLTVTDCAFLLRAVRHPYAIAVAPPVNGFQAMSSSHSKRAPGARNILFCVAISAALTACALGPNFHSPAPPATQHYTQGEQPQATA
jgi:hypothetical protein